MRLILTILTITLLAFVYLMPVYCYCQVLPPDTSALALLPHNHEGMRRCKKHHYYQDQLDANNYNARLNTIHNLLYGSKGGYILTDTAKDKDLGLLIKLDFSRDSCLAPFRKLVDFPELKPKDTLRVGREENIYLETAWKVSKYVFNEILHGESPYRFLAFYMISPRGKVLFVHSTQVDDEIDVKGYHWLKQSSKL